MPWPCTRSETRDDAARHAMDDAVLCNTETTDVNASVPHDSLEDPSWFVYTWYYETNIVSQRNVILSLPLHMYHLLAVGVISAAFDNATVQ